MLLFGVIAETWMGEKIKIIYKGMFLHYEADKFRSLVLGRFVGPTCLIHNLNLRLQTKLWPVFCL
jgi:hypothetical protein